MVTLTHFDRTPTKKDCLEAIDMLRKAVESGEVVMFAAVAVADNDAVQTFLGSSKPVSHLRLIGACARLAHYVQRQIDV